jgi:hypothetical protein
MYRGVPGIGNLKKSIINYYVEQYFGIDIQMKVTDIEFYIPSVWFDSLVLSPIFNYQI